MIGGLCTGVPSESQGRLRKPCPCCVRSAAPSPNALLAWLHAGACETAMASDHHQQSARRGLDRGLDYGLWCWAMRLKHLSADTFVAAAGFCRFLPCDHTCGGLLGAGQWCCGRCFDWPGQGRARLGPMQRRANSTRPARPVQRSLSAPLISDV